MLARALGWLVSAVFLLVATLYVASEGAGEVVKGAKNPYTSRNGYMTSFIDKAGEVSLRLSKADQSEFIEAHDSRVPVQYGKNMPDFAVVPP